MAEHSLAELGNRALEEVEALVGCPAEGVSSIHRTDEGWVAQVDVLELARVPETTDVLASYEVRIDDDGTIIGYRRTHRFLRSQVDGR